MVFSYRRAFLNNEEKCFFQKIYFTNKFNNLHENSFYIFHNKHSNNYLCIIEVAIVSKQNIESITTKKFIGIEWGWTARNSIARQKVE